MPLSMNSVITSVAHRQWDGPMTRALIELVAIIAPDTPVTIIEDGHRGKAFDGIIRGTRYPRSPMARASVHYVTASNPDRGTIGPACDEVRTILIPSTAGFAVRRAYAELVSKAIRIARGDGRWTDGRAPEAEVVFADGSWRVVLYEQGPAGRAWDADRITVDVPAPTAPVAA
jgi:hypothetical protein